MPGAAVKQDEARTAKEDERVWETREKDLQRFFKKNINRGELSANRSSSRQR